MAERLLVVVIANNGIVMKVGVLRRLMVWWSVLGGEFHTLLFLPLIAEPHANDVLLQVQFLGDGGNLLAGRTWLNGEVCLERALFGRCDGSPFS